MPRRSIRLLVLALAFGTSPGAAAQEAIGRSESLPATPGPHWMWIGDVLLRRAMIVDGSDGTFRGQVPAGNGIVAPHRAPDGREIYLAETYYDRGTRGARTDLVSVRDARTLALLAEIEIPAKRAEHTSWVGGSALSDDGRFLAVFNLNPATSLSIVDLAERRFVTEVETPGCALVYAGGTRRFFSLCNDGTALPVTLDDRGAVTAKAKSERFFDPETDPVLEKGVRIGSAWLFPSFEGQLHAIEVGGDRLGFAAPWSLTTEADRAESWRIGGMQPLAVHAESGRLYALMHQGGPDTHKDPGTEVWVYDVAKQARTQRIALRSPLVAMAAEFGELPQDGWGVWLAEQLLPNEGVERIAVTQGASPQLFATTQFPPTLSLYDATTGTHLRDVPSVGVATSLVQGF
jgi:methylamine dehydrogenase heavy chain